MANIAYAPGVTALVNGFFGPWAGIVNGGVALINVAPWIGELRHLTGTAPPPIKDLQVALVELYAAAEANDYEAFRAAAENVEQKIDSLTTEPSRENFKGYSMASMVWNPRNWDPYLKPLTDLKLELEHFRTRGIDGYDSSRLEGPLKGAVAFMNGEIKAHAGLLNKAFTTIAQEAKKVVRQEFGGILGTSDQALRIEPKLSPLQTLVYDVRKFRTNPRDYLPEYVSQTLLADLKALERYHPYFKGVERYVLERLEREEAGTLAEHLDTFLVAFIRERVVPEIDGPDLHLAYYQAGLKLKHVRESWITEDRERQAQWGRECLQERIESPKEKGTLFSAVAYILEMGHFSELERHVPTRHDSSKTLLVKVEKVITLIEEHPAIMMHPEFGPQIKELIGSYIKAGYRLDKSSLEGFQEAHRANHGNNFPKALLILRKVLAEPSQVRSRETSVIGQGLEALRTQAGQYGIPLPEAIMGPVESVARMVDTQVGSLMGSSGDEETLPPLMSLERNLQTFTAERADRSEATIQKALDKDLRGLEVAYLELHGITEFVRRNRGRAPYIEVMEPLVSRFILEQIGAENSPLRNLIIKHSSTFFQALYKASEARGLLKEAEHGLSKSEQVAWGRSLYETGEIRATILWEAVELVLKVENLERAVRSLELREEATPEELSRNVDVALSILEKSPHIDGVGELLSLVHAQVQSYLNIAAEFSSDLSASDEAMVDAEIDKAQALVRAGNPAGALKILKALFDKGPFLQVVGKVEREESPASAVAKLAADFEAEKAHTQGTLTPAVSQDEIQREERILAHNLSMFSTFKVMSSHCGLDPKTSEQLFERILGKIEEIPYDGSPEQLKNKREREKIFKDELDKMVDENSRFNFGFLTWIVFKLVKHFTSEFSKSLVQSTQNAMLNPSNQPLKGHHGVVRGINNGILALLFAERIWKQDGTGEHGINEKELKMIQILEGLNGGSQQQLIKQVVDKALNEFPIGTFSNNRVLNGIATFFVKGAARVIVNRMNLANTVLETMSDAIYSDKHINYNVDALLLKQIQEFEKILGEESGELVIREGDNGKRLVSQLVENLFTLLRERGEMTPGALRRHEESILERLSGAMGEQTDTIIKGVVRDLLIFGFEQLKEKERMNQTLLDVLRHANRALRPSTASLLRELYSDKPGIDSIPEEALVGMFEAEYRPDRIIGAVTRQECEAALQAKYGKIEEELHDAIGRILNETIKNVVVTQVQTHLKTPREAILEHLEWLHLQFDPHRAHLEKKRAYTEEMKELCRAAHSQKRDGAVRKEVREHIDTRHKKLLIQLKNQLSLLKSKESEDPSKANLQIKRLYKATNRLVVTLEKVNQALIADDFVKAHRHLIALEKQMQGLEGELMGIQMTLSWENLSTSERATETAYSVGRKGAEAATPAVRTFLNRWITPLAEESVAIYKSRAAFKAMVDQAVFRSYLEYQPSPDSHSHEETVAENVYLRLQKGWDMVDEEEYRSEMSPSYVHPTTTVTGQETASEMSMPHWADFSTPMY
ncbi:MAG: hypothetical protein KFB93_06490 [Simkaniaceae bacterium]|nr:MAG: hypothetical protein KFB93_06490 [Simkaniaceae bacterium]